jgi:sirohydrochlorin cobaltochelatase
MKQNKAILVVSFGTSHEEAIKAIWAIENQIAEEYSTYLVYRAFTSQMILNNLQNRLGIQYYNVAEAMAEMERDGIEQVIVQPTHIIAGFEFEKMVREVTVFRSCFDDIRIGAPLLDQEEDYDQALSALLQSITRQQDQALVLMGHGTSHPVDLAYEKLEHTCVKLGEKEVIVGTVEGQRDFAFVKTRLKDLAVKKVLLCPFMIVAGEHARNDMAGETNSWQSCLLSEGYEVAVILQGLGELKGIRDIFVAHVLTAKKISKPNNKSI